MNLALAFHAAAEKTPDKTAIYWGEETYPYQRVRAQSNWLASRLVEEYGVQPGDRVGIWLRNRPEFVSALFAVFQAGAVAVPINHFLKPDEVQFILNDAGIRTLITETWRSAEERVLSNRLPKLQSFMVDHMPGWPAPQNGKETWPNRDEADLAVIIYTSGTTGRPKGAMLSHGNLLHNVASCRQVLETVELDSIAVLLPMFHSFMLCVGVLLPMTSNCSIVVIKSLHPMKNILHEFLTGRATILPAIPQFFRTMAGGHVPDTLPLRLCISGAAPLPMETLERFHARFSVPLLEGYGLSEASPVVSINPIRGPVKPGSVGLPLPGVEVSVQDEQGDPLPDGIMGELCVRGGNVMQGYWNQPEESAKAFRNGWLLTGDVAYRDEEGYYFITDRKKDMLLVNGINVYPREIEEILYQFPGVREAAVIGRPDPRRGEQPVAYVTPEEGIALDVAGLQRFLREHLADYKVPRHIELLPGLPRNASGKILKTALRAM
jgi:long-chain acyl-CoA synthetase